MGYIFEVRNGCRVLVCDACGVAGGVRRRTCPHKVTSSSLRGGRRSSLPYCPPPALCSDCFKQHGGLAGLHRECGAGAARSQANYDAEQRLLDAGDFLPVSAFGDWAEGVPKGQVRVLFRNVRGDARERLLPKADYDARRSWEGVTVG